ncbi:MAG: TolC family protein [Gammaproteobacteria bacterium]|nr:TolC family protein [Gammaproteobacteria bacterium]
MIYKSLPSLICVGLMIVSPIWAETSSMGISYADIHKSIDNAVRNANDGTTNILDALNFSGPSISLHEALSKTIKSNPTLRTYEYKIKAQEGRALQSSFPPSPELNLSIEDVYGNGRFEGADAAQTTLSISWVIEGSARQRQIDLANIGKASLTSEAEINLLDVSAETAQHYLISLANQARLVNAFKSLTLSKKMESVIKKRVQAGTTTKAELARAQVDVMRSELVLEDIEHELKSSNRLLAAQWGNTEPAFSMVEGNIFSLPVIQSFATLKARLEKSPEFTRLLSAKRLKQAELKLAEAKGSFNWRVNLGVRHSEVNKDQALVAGVSIPFGGRSRNTGGIAEAQANLSQLNLKEDELRVAYETSLYVLYQEMQHSLHRVNAYRHDIIPLLEKALKETRRAYKLGRYSYLELRSVQTELLTARNTLVEASIDVHLKGIEIERLTGLRVSQQSTKL